MSNNEGMGAKHIDRIDFYLRVVTALVIIVGFVVGLMEYSKGQKWEKGHLILELINDFEGDEKIQAACQMLDYDNGIIYLGSDTIVYNVDTLIDVFTLKEDSLYTIPDKIIISTFGVFFDYFQKI